MAKKKNLKKKNSEMLTFSELKYDYEEKCNPHNDPYIVAFLQQCKKEVAKDNY